MHRTQTSNLERAGPRKPPKLNIHGRHLGSRSNPDVAINYLPAQEPDAQEVLGLIKDEGRVGLGIPGDLREESFCKRLVSEAAEGLGGLDIVVCNAGRQQTHASIEDTTTDSSIGQ